MAYTKVDWVDGTTPLNEANLDHIEQGIADAHAGLPPSPVGQDGKWLHAVGGAMVWDVLAGGGGGGLDWEGAWGAATPYVKGDVVTYNGVVYGAVNDGTGQTPPSTAAGAPAVTPTPIPLVTALPSSPFDGQEVIFVDSLTAPTYQWRFRYVAAKATNKWVFVGGAPGYAEAGINAEESTASTTWADLATDGPTFTIPVVGLYVCEGKVLSGRASAAAAYRYVAFFISGGQTNYTLASGAADDRMSLVVDLRAQLSAGAVLKLRYQVGGSGTVYYFGRTMKVTPIAVGG